jgi:3-deoxy-D-manno-octulosonic-acid transferase
LAISLSGWRPVTILLTILYLFALLLLWPAIGGMLLLQPKKRAGLGAKLGFIRRRASDRPAIWVHAVSVGETLAAKSIVNALARRHPDHEVVVSVTTRTGMEVARKTYPDRRVFYYPFDFAFSVSAALRRIRPNLVLLVEQEVWPVFVAACERRGIPVAVVNGRITERAFRGYRRWRFLMGPAFRRVRLFAMQTEEYAARIRGLGVPSDRIHVTGSVKYDTVKTDVDEAALGQYRRLFGFRDGDRVLLAGSTHAGEDELALATFEALRARFPDLRLVLVPRHPERFESVAALLKGLGRPFVRRSALRDATVNGADKRLASEVVLVDTMGELAALNGLADLVFVGGSLVPFGGHNLMDPAGLGKPVLFGPHVWNFREAADALLAAGGGVQVDDGPALTRAVEWLLADPAAAADLGRRARQIVLDRRGATDRTLTLVAPLLTARS